MESLADIRHTLHTIPEPSGSEQQTADYIAQKLRDTQPDALFTNIGGHGIIAVYESGTPGPCIGIRAELDALPITEQNTLPYGSTHEGYAHSCGHDGHMTIILGLAYWLQKEKTKLSGKVILIFQPAEENASGAKLVVSDNSFCTLSLDYIFSLHNVPGYPVGTILIKQGVFAQASKGLIVSLHGKSSHAAHPSQGINPVLAMTDGIQQLIQIPESLSSRDQSNLVTIIHARLGKIAFGTSPGEATIMATFRSSQDEHLQRMSESAESLIATIAHQHGLTYSIEWVDHFPAVSNDDRCVEIIKSAAQQLEYDIHQLSHPFLWSEDFSYFTQHIKGAMFGIGSGENHPHLHNPNYDFPDEIINPTVQLYQHIILTILYPEKKQV